MIRMSSLLHHSESAFVPFGLSRMHKSEPLPNIYKKTSEEPDSDDDWSSSDEEDGE
jgi:hypothetical protein